MRSRLIPFVFAASLAVPAPAFSLGGVLDTVNQTINTTKNAKDTVGKVSSNAPAPGSAANAPSLAGANAGTGGSGQDPSGGADHPVLSRYAGSTVYTYGSSNYASAPVIVRSGKDVAQQQFEGKITNRLYLAPAGKTPLEVYRNYQAALKNGGFTVLFECEAPQCDKSHFVDAPGPFYVKAFRLVADANWEKYDPDMNDMPHPDDDYYISAQKSGPNGVTTVQIALTAHTSGQRVEQFVQVIDSANMDMGQVTVNAEAISNALKESGKIALYGILFDTNKAVLKPESAPALEQMAKALKADPSIKVYIVGHTDNQGSLEANQTLSQRRAEAVVTALSTQYSIPVARMTARGVANLSPVASNGSEDGRGKNRRVEMVLY